MILGGLTVACRNIATVNMTMAVGERKNIQLCQFYFSKTFTPTPWPSPLCWPLIQLLIYPPINTFFLFSYIIYVSVTSNNAAFLAVPRAAVLNWGDLTAWLYFKSLVVCI